ncbi:unnamed protein product [Didymodactylos carnosus]|uniref:UDP-glucuronosyltransferase n=1 Tax=Didymodactylos carnosus TaxID=1234261 RepID=A0A8S2PPL4_9BILA|nr:unnamed protein product [Didymodactylos carnosus]CAF4064058.1 unnamed protein product [Didymodactylos carnosus]
MSVVKILVPSFYKMLQSAPRVPGPFYESFALTNVLFSKPKCLELISIPPSFYTPSYSNHYTKYLGPFVDETSIDHADDDLTNWINSKPIDSIIYTAFGSTSVIKVDRMQNLLNGLVAFLLQTPGSSVLVAFRSANYETYQTVLSDIKNDEFRRILNDDQRVKVENGFVKQKWILQQNSVKLFFSHCGMGSSLEALYFQNPVLCMPFGMDQFVNAIVIDRSSVGLSLFVPPSPLQSLINPLDFTDYKFSASSVTTKLSIMWRNAATYKKAVRIMSLEMKHAGGLRRAVEEIEFLVNLDGDLDRYAPFSTTLPFCQRYMLDLVMIYVVLPAAIITYFVVKCCNSRLKVGLAVT